MQNLEQSTKGAKSIAHGATLCSETPAWFPNPNGVTSSNKTKNIDFTPLGFGSGLDYKNCWVSPYENDTVHFHRVAPYAIDFVPLELFNILKTNFEQSTKGATSLTQGATLCNKIKFVQSPKGTQSIAQGVNPVKKIQFNSNPKEVKLFIN